MPKRSQQMDEESDLRVEPLKANESRSELGNAAIVFHQAVDAVDNFHGTYIELRENRKGATSHGEQDLLRAMLVFACSGLDAVVKQLLHDSLAAVIDCDIGAEKEFEKFVERRFKKTNLSDDKEKGATGGSIDAAMLASAIVSKSPRAFLIEMLHRNLTGDSLQSLDQLLRVASHFAITRDQVISSTPNAKDGFRVRNEIIHEMDVDLSAKGAGKRRRRQRTYEDMKKYSETMLSISAKFINAVSEKLCTPDPGNSGQASVSPAKSVKPRALKS